MNTPHISPEVYEHAADWLERLSSGPLDKLSKRRFINWIDADPAHKQVFESMLSTWSSPALHQALADTRQNMTLKDRIQYTPSSRWWQAATLCVVCLVMVIAWQWRPQQVGPITHQYATAIGESRDITIEDGSVLTMSAASDVFVKLTDDRRLINLKKGAAYFDVASNKQRPFEVKIGSASVVAVGTEFNIDRGQNFTDVVVHEGAVEVKASIDDTPILLKAGERVRITGQTLTDTEAVDLTRTLDWRSGWLELTNESLPYLVERLNRESHKAIRIESAALANLRIAGRFRLKDTEQALHLLAEAYPLIVEERGSYYSIQRQP